MAEPEPSPPPHRLLAIDLLRGAVMVLMLLDHARDFLHYEGLSADPTDPARTTAALFFTRWATHFCAPVFVLLAGLAVRLQLQRVGDARAVAARLWRRGLGLVALELVVLRPLIWFQLDYGFLAHLQVIWAIGWSMVALSLLLRAPSWLPLLLGALIVAGHGLLPHVPFAFAPWRSPEAMRLLAFGRGSLAFGDDGPFVFVQYAVVPWFGVMLLGFALGALYALPAATRRRWLAWLGLGALLVFALLRATGAYGDPTPWTAAPDPLRSLFSFLRVEKYPPSLQYCLMTLGPALLVLALTDGLRAAGCWSPLVVLGRVPLFFYVLQWPAVHLCARLFQWLAGQPLGWDAVNPVEFERLPPGCGFPLLVVYAGWAVCLLVLMPLAYWWDRRGRRRRSGQRTLP